MNARNSRDPESIVRDIHKKTRRKFSAEEKIRIVLEGLKGEVSISELCRREGIAVKSAAMNALHSSSLCTNPLFSVWNIASVFDPVFRATSSENCLTSFPKSNPTKFRKPGKMQMIYTIHTNHMG